MDQTQTTDLDGRSIDVSACIKGKALYMPEMRLSQIPQNIWVMNTLNGLVLSNNLLIELPATVSALTELRLLEFSGNRISSLPSTISCLTKLRTVNAARNQIRFIPPEIGALLNLTFLSVSDNNIEFVPEEIGRLSKLKLLDFSKNSLTVLPKELSCLVALSHLDIHSNPITRLLCGTANLSSLCLFIIEHEEKIMIKSGPTGISKLPCWNSTERPFDTMKWTISQSLQKIKLEDIPDPPPPILDPLHATVSSMPYHIANFYRIQCESFRLAKRTLLGQFKGYPAEMFDGFFDKCFCSLCFVVEHGKLPVKNRGDPPAIYVPPAGWARIGLSVDKGFIKLHQVFEKWHYTFHGTSLEKVGRILYGNKVLLKAGDVALGGGRLKITDGHVERCHSRINHHTKVKENFNPHQIFTSPSIIYSSNDIYAEAMELSDPNDPSKKFLAKVVLQTRQRPGSYKIGQETIGASRQIDPYIPNSSIEYFTEENMAILVYGILVRLEPV